MVHRACKICINLDWCHGRDDLPRDCLLDWITYNAVAYEKYREIARGTPPLGRFKLEENSNVQ